MCIQSRTSSSKSRQDWIKDKCPFPSGEEKKNPLKKQAVKRLPSVAQALISLSHRVAE